MKDQASPHPFAQAPQRKNQAFALEMTLKLIESGVREFCVCPGARNSPLSALLLDLQSRNPGLRIYHHFEERSASFFALGRIKGKNKPIAVITTSGTAVGELLPATMEAYYAGAPLILLTADRPRRFRGSGAPQTAEQRGIFGIYAELCIDLEAGETLDLSRWSRRSPLHLNACFDEPLLDRSAETEVSQFAVPELSSLPPSQSEQKLSASQEAGVRDGLRLFLGKSRYPIAIVSALSDADRDAVLDFLEETQIPVYLEGPSGLREEPRLAKNRIHISDGLITRARLFGYPIDAVLRIGSVPTLRLWRDIEATQELPVFSLSREPFSGLSWMRTHGVSIRSVLGPQRPPLPRSAAFAASRAFLRRDLQIQSELESLFSKYPSSEPALFRDLSQKIDRGRLFIGNSLPIREWDLAASFSPPRGAKPLQIGASRGLNGIDGQISTFLGFCDPLQENWGILGDLTTLYDLPAPWILSQLDPGLRATLVIINNGGGKIFSRMFPQHEFQNRHEIRFDPWAQLWGLPYEHWTAVPASDREWGGGEKGAKLRIVELTPQLGETDAFWKEASLLWG